MQSPDSDEILVQRILSGDASGFKMLVSRYQNMVFTIVLRITANREEAEEVAQDVFMKVYKSLPAFEGKSKFSSWLYRIAYNTALSSIRNKKQDILSLDNEKMAAALNIKTSSAIYNEAEKEFVAADVSKAISMIDAEDATIITLFYLSEQSIEEIGQILNIGPNAAKVRLHRARKKLKEKMEMSGFFKS
jgi:RNA polymerase sigma factor (sigma-70 family)